MNQAISVIIIGVLLVASFFIGYSIKGTGSDSSKIEFLQKQITNLQNQNIQLQQQIDELQKNDEEQPQAIPSSVLAKYKELEPQYKQSLGVSINYCTKNTEKIYLVSGSGGYTGVRFFYTKNGNEIGSYSFSDAIDVNNPPPKPPVNIQEYDCTIIKKSEQFVN